MTTFTVSVYAGIPKKDTEPLLSFTIDAESGLDAQEKVRSRKDFKQRPANAQYVEAKPS